MLHSLVTQLIWPLRVLLVYHPWQYGHYGDSLWRHLCVFLEVYILADLLSVDRKSLVFNFSVVISLTLLYCHVTTTTSSSLLLGQRKFLFLSRTLQHCDWIQLIWTPPVRLRRNERRWFTTFYSLITMLFAGAVFTVGSVGAVPNNTICKYGHPTRKTINSENHNQPKMWQSCRTQLNLHYLSLYYVCTFLKYVSSLFMYI